MSKEVIPYSILFIEDEEAIRSNYVDYLKRYYKEVFEAEDGEKAYLLYKEKKPDILIVDINLPKLNGLELIKRIRQHDQNTKVIMLTAYADTKYLLDATELNLVKYLVKPITREALKEALSLAIQALIHFTISTNQIVQLREDFFYNIQTNELFNRDIFIYMTKTEKNSSLYCLNIRIVFLHIMKLWSKYGMIMKMTK